MFLRYAPSSTPQTTQADPRQIPNHAGGWAFEVDKWTLLERFLTIGTEAGTYYVGRDDLTKQNTENVQACLAEDGARTVAVLERTSSQGRAVKQDYGIYVLALALATDDQATRQAAYAAIPCVCRTASSLFQLFSYLRGRRGSSRGLKSAVARWYEDRSVDDLAYQLVKYRQRHDWTHRDLLRLSHPKPNGKANLYRWAVGKEVEGELPAVVRDFLAAEKATGDERIALAKRLPREALPTKWLKEPAILEALLYGEGAGKGMPLTALIRNLGNLSRYGILTPRSDAARYVVGELLNETRIRKARVHPISLLIAEKVYGAGHGLQEGGGTWTPVEAVRTALGEAFLKALGNVEPSGKPLLVAVDVSGSMRTAFVQDVPNLSAAEVALAMAYVYVRTEPKVTLTTFNTGIQEYQIDPDSSFDRFRSVVQIAGGGTNISLPYLYASQKRAEFDAFVTFTDNETWAGGSQHPHEAWNAYRLNHRRSRTIIASTTATNLTAVRDDSVLQVSGFDAATPQVIAAYLAA